MDSVVTLVALLAGMMPFISGCERFSSNRGDSLYCICDSNYCDKVPSVSKSSNNLKYTLISSSKEGLRFYVTNGTFSNSISNARPNVPVRITINKGQTFQNILGFGGAMTDSAGFNIKSLTDDMQEKLLGSYFGYDSIDYNMIRVPIGTTDFSPRPYSYAMSEYDFALEKFSLTSEDNLYKIPNLKRINLLSLRKLKLIASPWTPSPWMKTQATWTGKSILRREYWQTWANYFVKFFQAYEKNNLNFWGITPQNEPRVAFSTVRIPNMGWEPKDQREWITKFLAPSLKLSQLDYLKIIIGDGSIQLLPNFVRTILSTKEAKETISGIAVHSYKDKNTSLNFLDRTQKLFPDKFLLNTEAILQDEQKVKLGSWSRAEDYANSIIDSLSHWVAGWIDSNMALDLQGGPNWLNRFADSPIIVNSSANVFYKQPTYYIMGHFSKFIPPDSKRISTIKRGSAKIKSIAFLTPDQATVVILLNPYKNKRDILIEDALKGSTKVTLAAKSIHSMVYCFNKPLFRNIFVYGCDKYQAVKGDSGYCICDSNYCDQVPNVVKSQDQLDYTVVSSSRDGLRFHVTNGKFGKEEQGRAYIKITIDNTKAYQNIIGFGSSMTDAAGINIKSLTEDVQDKLLESYFGPGSIEYNLIRVPMGASDFSPRPYSYAMTESDFALDNFALAEEDYKYKIPFLTKIHTITEREVNLIASPWSPSPWMKTGGDWTGKGFLRREYWQTWANYFVKFFQEYKKNEIQFWATTIQNEPVIAHLMQVKMPTMTWYADDQREWLTKFFAPIMKKANFDDIKIIVGDGQRALLTDYIPKILKTNEAKNLVSGIGAHWYFDWLTSPNTLDKTNNLYPDKFIIYTEASEGLVDVQKVRLGSWTRAENYAKNIIENLSHWVTGWIDWNMALNMEGGPNWVRNFVDSPIIVNTKENSFYKQPMYYVMGHFSKFILPGSKRINTIKKGIHDIKHVAFVTPEKATVLILMNPYNMQKDVFLEDGSKGTVTISLPAKSIHSVVYWN
ncbi:uncharacterized protein LOC127280694 [Leptopilina boulardi]|uniref:uncharacterized protein LOC127280694 n=1 Tax=Leptopilina boulardi TaxID=63433 RepID=UPI0021F57F10|nr:uncharacterized protein LOC127280694 [Leptopilina boulardi]